jgi:hypothetical protein
MKMLYIRGEVGTIVQAPHEHWYLTQSSLLQTRRLQLVPQFLVELHKTQTLSEQIPHDPSQLIILLPENVRKFPV